MSDNATPDHHEVRLPPALHGIVADAQALLATIEENCGAAAQEMTILTAPVQAAVLATLDFAYTALAMFDTRVQHTVRVPLPSIDVDATTDATALLGDAVARLGHTETGFPVALALLDPHDRRKNITFRAPDTFLVDFHLDDGSTKRHEVADLDAVTDLVEGRCLSTHTGVSVSRVVRENGTTLVNPVEIAFVA